MERQRANLTTQPAIKLARLASFGDFAVHESLMQSSALLQS